MKFFTVAAFFAAAVMASPTAPIPGAAAGNGNAPEITQSQTKINQSQQNSWNTVCSAQKGYHPVCCDKVDASKTSTANLGLLSGLLGNGLGDILGLNNLVGGNPEACSGLVSALNKQCQTNIGCCQQNSDSSNTQNGLLNLNLQAPCLLSNGL
ncbi:hypothetical protein BDV27DRAFT_132244 [Aspergillus caelatus]|uniref:Uncharacterized protein n=2 Tax=Aspergillus subgen. Circumdati TaxID=2720871 RepID=A0A5N6ZWJ6_9EURO|nr:uncharacterized protein BDV27DRAFT_132244 [Aspergillus caelatus]KAE8361991.1 hypothetical protein BDV27DRAFT_132244 [Aspergillus caelatus]KAE8422188.1 hypothetical protein BDV36DRAFT_291688 [Aspergillus pseudocaelatus]